MAFGKDEQPTTSSPAPQVISPSTDAKTSAIISQATPIQNGIDPQTSTIDSAKQNEEQRPHTTSKLVEILLVIGQFIALIVILFGFIPPLLWQNTFLQVFGMLLIGAALFIGIWALLSFKQKMNILPSPTTNGFLVTGGPFTYIRHPVYFSLITASIGITLAYPTIPRIIALLVLLVVLHKKASLEETLLAKRFNGYETYKKHTGSLVPKLHKK